MQLLKPEDLQDIERRAAMLYFQHGVQNEQAMAMAYQEYKEKSILQGLAFHYSAFEQLKHKRKLDANRHFLMVALYAGVLNKTVAEVPKLVENLPKVTGEVNAYTGHPADTLVLSDPNAATSNL